MGAFAGWERYPVDYGEALERLKSKGYKYTGKRESIVRLFAKQDRYLSAKEVQNCLSKDYPGLSLDTVYRNLSLFEQLGILEGTEWEGERRYRFRCEEDRHHHHLICTECGRTRTIHICPMNAILGQPEDFEITGHKFEIYGRCAECGNQ
jgi:Fur family zinc uptake transcriptional regulator